MAGRRWQRRKGDEGLRGKETLSGGNASRGSCDDVPLDEGVGGRRVPLRFGDCRGKSKCGAHIRGTEVSRPVEQEWPDTVLDEAT